MTEQHKSKNRRWRERIQLPVLPRRDALKGLGVLAVSGAALGAAGCADSAPAAAPAATGAGMSASTPASATSASTSVTAGTPAKSVGTSSAPSASTAGPATPASTGAGTPAATSGSAAPAASSSGGALATSAGNSAAATGGTAASAAGGTTGAAGAGAAGSVGLDSLACIMSPAMTDGPFFVEEKLNRSDLVMGETDEAIVKALPLKLTLGVYSVSGMTCKPASGLQVDIWHANALGIYSDVRSGAVQSMDTQGKKFLRGFQVTDEAGQVTFGTIYPGWYQSRTIHIHVKVRMPMGSNKAYDFTSQIFFEESVNSMVLSQGPYSKAPGMRMVFNDDDHIYNGTASNGQKPAAGKTAPGAQMTAVLSKTATGYAAVLKLGIKV